MFPKDVQEFLLLPIINQLISEMQDVCSENCTRISSGTRNTLTEDKDEVDSYWMRLEPAGMIEPEERQSIQLERFDAPCDVGFKVDKDNHCPLYAFEPTTENNAEFLEIIKHVATFRKAEAATKLMEKV